MEKHGELVVGYSRCDRCGRKAVIVSGSRKNSNALCTRCAAEKQASLEVPLKGAASQLSSQHKD